MDEERDNKAIGKRKRGSKPKSEDQDKKQPRGSDRIKAGIKLQK